MLLLRRLCMAGGHLAQRARHAAAAGQGRKCTGFNLFQFRHRLPVRSSLHPVVSIR